MHDHYSAWMDLHLLMTSIVVVLAWMDTGFVAKIYNPSHVRGVHCRFHVEEMQNIHQVNIHKSHFNLCVI